MIILNIITHMVLNNKCELNLAKLYAVAHVYKWVYNMYGGDLMKILNIGSMNLDYVYRVKSIVKPGETISAQGLDTVPGGKGLNQSVAFARAGAGIWHAGCYGAAGKPLIDLLSKNRVNTDYMKQTDAPQGNAIIQVEDSGNNSIIVFGGSNRCLERAQIDCILAGFSAGDMLTLQNEVNELDYIIQKAWEKGLCVILNPSPFDDEILKTDLGRVTWLVMNETETKALTGEDDAEKAYEMLHKKYPALNVIITMGTQGAYCFAGETKVFQPAFKVQAVDTTAAGDTFTGYFFASLADGKEIAECLRIAAKASAIGVTRPGASPSIPYIAEVLSSF